MPIPPSPPVTIAGRQVRVVAPPQTLVRLPKPHRFRRCHWVTVSARRIPAESTPAAVPQTQLLQSCTHDCGRHRTRIIPGHWQAGDVVHPAAPRPPRAIVRTEVGDLAQTVELHGRELARAVAALTGAGRS